MRLRDDFMAIILLLAFAALTLIFLEFFLPGAILAVMGSIILLISLGLFFIGYPILWGVAYLLAMLFGVFLTCKLALWRLKCSQKKADFYHGEDQEGYLACFFDKSLIGKEGIVATELKPSGHILVGGKLYQALSESNFISKDSPVQILGGKGSHLIVKRRK